jgi:hypothetical protein
VQRTDTATPRAVVRCSVVGAEVVQNDMFTGAL